MTIVRVTFKDWNGESHTVEVSEAMCAAVGTNIEEKAIYRAIQYVKRRYTECLRIVGSDVVRLRRDGTAPNGTAIS